MRASLFDPPPPRFALRDRVRLRGALTAGIVAAVQHHCGGSRYTLRLDVSRRLSNFLPESALEFVVEASHGS